MDSKEKKIYVPVDYLNFEDKKIASIIIDLLYWKNTDNLVNITLDKLISDCGYVPKTGKGKTNEKFKNSLIFLQENDIIKCDIDLNTIRTKDLLTIKVKSFERDKSHIALFYSSYKKIMEDNVKITMKENMLLLYLHIKRGIGAKNTFGREIKYKSITNDTLMKKCTISKDTLSGCLKELTGIGLIYYDNIGYVIKNDTVKKASNVYTLEYDNLDIGLKASKKYYKDRGYTFESRGSKLNKVNEEYEEISEEEMNKFNDLFD